MPDFKMIRFRPAINLVICVVFVITLSLPLVFQAIGIQFNNSTTEKRKKSEFPGINITPDRMSFPDIALFIDQFNSYYSDNFAIRQIMIELYINTKIKLLHTNPFPKKLVFGKGDWIFLGDSYSNAIAETKGIKNFSEPELETITKNIIEYKKYFDEKHIKFFLVVAPEKSTVYGQKLPIKLSVRQTKLEQVRKQLSAIGINLIDLKDHFSKDQNYPLYYKTDSHWNHIGMYFGSLSLMKTIGLSYPMLKILKFEDFSIDSSKCNFNGDLAGQLSLKTQERKYILTSEFHVERIKLPNKLTIPESYSYNPKLYERRFETKNGKLKILIFHDSFFQEMHKFIAESFRETVFIWTVWEKEIIEQEKPDIVVYEMVEREIDKLLYPLN
jgi:hypothetical protein